MTKGTFVGIKSAIAQRQSLKNMIANGMFSSISGFSKADTLLVNTLGAK